MRSTARSRPIRAWLARLTLVLAAGLAAGPGAVMAQDDPPGRVGRLADMQGQVWWFDVESGAWSEAERNRPLTGGDRLSTAPDARAELRVGSTVLRLGGASEMEVLRLDDEHLTFQLHAGSLALRVRSREVAGEVELVTAEARLRPLRSGHYRLDRIDDTTHAGSWSGSLRIDDAAGFLVDTGQRAELWREGGQRVLRHAWASLPDDGFAQWVAAAEQRDQRSAATQYVSPEMTGVEDLDRYGRWDRHPEYGVLWFPYAVRADWAPYRHGRWAWVRPWGWTWVDESPWGFAPFHYGRWVHWQGRWGWWPGAYAARPVFAPALVAWVGGTNWGVSVQIGGPAVGWLPLAPLDVFVPWYRATPIYVDRVNRHPHPPPGRRPAPPRHTGPIMYGNQGVPGAVTVVPRDVLVRREPVSRAVIGPHGAVPPGRPLVRVEPPQAPVPRAGGPRPQPQQQPQPQPPRSHGRDPRDAPGARMPGEVRAPREASVARPAPREAADPRPAPRVAPAPGVDERHDRRAPAEDADPGRRMGPERPARPVVPAPRSAAPSERAAAPAAATAPAAERPTAPPRQPGERRPPPPPAAPPAVRTPAPPPAATPAPAPSTAPAPAPAPAAAAPPAPAAKARAPVDERKQIPESRTTSRESER